MATTVDLGGNDLVVNSIKIGATAPGQAGTAETATAATFTVKQNFSAGLNTKQAVTNVHDTTPTDAELDSAFGTPASLGRGFIGVVDDADGDTNGYIAWTSDASWYWLKGTKAT